MENIIPFLIILFIAIFFVIKTEKNAAKKRKYIKNLELNKRYIIRKENRGFDRYEPTEVEVIEESTQYKKLRYKSSNDGCIIEKWYPLDEAIIILEKL